MAGEGIPGKEVTWRVRDRLVRIPLPAVMGILNATPDSFHAPSRVTLNEVVERAERMLQEGATFLDIGGASSRPGSEEISLDAELERSIPIIQALHGKFPEALLSIDTTHARVAQEAVHAGASMINDITAGLWDEAMLPTVAALGVPYVIMHMQGAPRTMQDAPHYTDVVAEVTLFLSQRSNAAHAAGIADVIIDPGFGFGKDVDHNYALLAHVQRLTHLHAPVLVGLSRKRMINAVLGTSTSEALNGTTVLNTIALMNGASILRVHDVREAVECVKLVHAVRRDQK
ncbi:MAG: dihydropteroate synthase [Flavobacteriales bacterium]|nr:dihydropteroate synthase [Flavobacteriales bacterium]